MTNNISSPTTRRSKARRDRARLICPPLCIRSAFSCQAGLDVIARRWAAPTWPSEAATDRPTDYSFHFSSEVTGALGFGPALSDRYSLGPALRVASPPAAQDYVPAEQRVPAASGQWPAAERGSFLRFGCLLLWPGQRAEGHPHRRRSENRREHRLGALPLRGSAR